ncbi:MAG: hypothetical protein ACRELY_25625 [Polyangiaceae bacterium]
MNRSMKLIACVLVLGAGAIACNKTAQEDQDKMNSAQQQADQKIANAQQQSTTTITNAQLEADKKISAANNDFMRMRESYRHDQQTNLIDLDGNVQKLDDKERTAKGQTKIALDNDLQTIATKRTAFLTTLQSVDSATAATFDDAKARNDKAWTDLKAAVDKASP